jgi:hypothetical protein
MQYLIGGKSYSPDLMPDDLRKQMPALYSQEEVRDPQVVAHYYCPNSGWHWFAYEGGQLEDGYFFYGLVKGFETEFGSFNLEEMEATGAVLRDAWWQPKPLSEARKEFGC